MPQKNQSQANWAFERWCQRWALSRIERYFRVGSGYYDKLSSLQAVPQKNQSQANWALGKICQWWALSRIERYFRVGSGY